MDRTRGETFNEWMNLVFVLKTKGIRILTDKSTSLPSQFLRSSRETRRLSPQERYEDLAVNS